MGWSPGPGRSHMPQSKEARAPQLLSLCATTTEACAPRAHAPQQKKPPQRKARASQRRVAPLAATREGLRTATKTQRSQDLIN